MAAVPNPQPVGAGNRLSAALAHAHQRAADRLAPQLEQVNRRTYLQALQLHAKALGARPPRTLTDQRVLDGITARAQVSAQSIAETRAGRMAALVQQTGSVAAARPTFDDWQRQQGTLISRYEAGQTAGQAAQDFYQRNQGVLTGTAHVEPAATRSDDICADLIDAGEMDLADATDDLPAHANCPHHWVRTYDLPDDPAGLWLGQDDGDEGD